MGKRQTVNNHIENVSMEIDYDKLAKAIVKAQEMVKGADNDPQREKVGFWKALKVAVVDSRKSKGQMTAMTFCTGNINSIFLHICNDDAFRRIWISFLSL